MRESHGLADRHARQAVVLNQTRVLRLGRHIVEALVALTTHYEVRGEVVEENDQSATLNLLAHEHLHIQIARSEVVDAIFEEDDVRHVVKVVIQVIVLAALAAR